MAAVASVGGGWTSWPSPAKLNLFLRILGRRADGYHELQTVFQLLDWGDTVHLRRREDGILQRQGGATAHLPEAEDLLLRAAKALQQHAKCRLGADLSVDKYIPFGGGFGGGSSNAATVLRALNAVWNTQVPLAELAELGLQLGADVPVFVYGDNAWAEGVGERLAPVMLEPSWYLIVDPGVSVPTRELFQAPELTRDAAPATIRDFVSGTLLGNAFEPVLRRLQPAVDATLKQLSMHGTAFLTGTGSGCFMRFGTAGQAEQVRSALPAQWRTWVVAGAMESPLKKAIAAFAGA